MKGLLFVPDRVLMASQLYPSSIGISATLELPLMDMIAGCTSSLSWMFLTASSVLSFITLFTIRPALSEGKRATTGLILNILAALFCMSSLTCFLATLVLQDPYLLHNLGWSFYICCASLIYALVVNVALGLVRVATAIEPVTTVEKTSELAMSHIKSPRHRLPFTKLSIKQAISSQCSGPQRWQP
ncbi:UNVERIFIED_CONTAM: hypothetical protein FKN15_074391 [Acipenser sinensis]